MVPVEPAVLGAFAVAVTAIVISPGPDTAIILRHALASGRAAGFAAVAGVQVGLVAHTALAVAGITVIIASSPVLFRLVAVGGAAYLAWLGIQGFVEAGPLSLDRRLETLGSLKAFRDGAVSNLLNPKVILLYLALFPNFVDEARGAVAAQLVTLAFVLIAINVVWQAPLACAAEVVRRALTRPAVARTVSRATGAVLVLFAGLLLYEHLF